MHAEVILLLIKQAYGLPVPAAHEEPWQFWFDLATLGLNSNYYCNPVPPTLKEKARDNLSNLALGQTDIDVVREIITKINARNDPYLNPMTSTLHEHAEGLRRQRKSESRRGEASKKRRRLDVPPEPRGERRGHEKHRAASEAPRGSGSSNLSAQRSLAPGTASTPEERHRDRLPTPSTSSDSAGPGEANQISTEATNDSPQASLPVLSVLTMEHVETSTQHEDPNEALDNSAKNNDHDTTTPRASEEEDSLAEGEYFVQKIKSHRYLDLVKWRGRSEQRADWMLRGPTLRKGLRHADRILDSKLELEIQYEGYPEGETTWEAEHMLRCPNLVGPNLLEQYKEKHKLGVYQDSD